MNEIWKEIEGYEGKYEVSNLGNVRSLKYARSNKVKLLKQASDHGYKRVNLFKNGKRKSHWVHRLVAIAFLPNPNNLPQVNHKDENKTNNRMDNLEWCTIKYNMNYGTRNERQSKSLSKRMTGKYKGKDSPNAKSILMYDREGNFIRRFDCIGDANEYFGKARYCSAINKCLKGRNKTAYGYIFKYAEKNN